MTVIETERLVLSHVEPSDSGFIQQLLNDPAFLQYIGDRGVRSEEDARVYIDGMINDYRKYGYGMYMTRRKDTGDAIGICGLVKRDCLAVPDVGFAFLPRYRGMGFASESAASVLDHALNVLGLERVVAVLSPDNTASVRLLTRLGFQKFGLIRLNGATGESALFIPQDGQA